MKTKRIINFVKKGLLEWTPVRCWLALERQNDCSGHFRFSMTDATDVVDAILLNEEIH